MRVLFDVESDGSLMPVVLDDDTPAVSLNRRVRPEDALAFKSGFSLCNYVEAEGGVQDVLRWIEEDTADENTETDDTPSGA